MGRNGAVPAERNRTKGPAQAVYLGIHRHQPIPLSPIKPLWPQGRAGSTPAPGTGSDRMTIQSGTGIQPDLDVYQL